MFKARNKRVIGYGVVLMLILSFLSFASLPALSQKKTTVRIWFVAWESTFIKPMMNPIFEALNPGITLKHEIVPWDQLTEKYMSAVASGTMPDVGMMSNQCNYSGIAAAGGLYDLSEYINKWGDKADIPPSFWKLYTWEEKIYGLPWFGDISVMFYRKDILKEAGYAEPSATQAISWDELIRMSKKLTTDTNGDGTIDRWTFDNGTIEPLSYGWPAFWWQFAGGILNKDYTKAALNNEQGLKAGQLIYDLVYKYHVLPTFEERGLTGNDILFIQGNTVMTWAEGWWLQHIPTKGGPRIEGKWSTSIFPQVDPAHPVAHGTAMALGMGANTKHPDEAWKYMEFMLDPTQQMLFYDLTACLPIRMSVWELPKMHERQVVPFGETLSKYSKTEPYIPGWAGVLRPFNEAVEKILRKVESPQQALGKAASEINEALAR
ncbi:hypothetical protein ES703_33515 [subsurface metagenome]